MRLAALFLFAAGIISAETFKLYLKSGEFHMVREYQLQADRVRYYSTERGDWEEIPKDLVDLSKTESERKGRSEAQTREARAQDEEEKAERAQQKEIASIPMEAGAYFKGTNEKIMTLGLSDFQVITDKKRKMMQIISPIPLVPGKAIVVIKGEHSSFKVRGDDRPNFFLRLAKEEKFGVIRLQPRKGQRVVENISIIPVSKQSIEDRKQMNTFEQQLMWNLYRVWPEKALEPGEYALMEYAEASDTDDLQLMIWDFAIER